MAPVTVFLVAIACLLAATAAVRPLALRTSVPEAVWLIGLGVVLRATGLVSTATIAALAPFFAAIALIIVLFEAGRDMVFGASGEQVGRARKLALVGAGLVVPLVALFSQALSGLQLLPVWSWTHAFMLGALMMCTAPEVFAPTLYRRTHPGLVATLEREAAITGALAIAATAFCIDLLSLRVPVGKAYAAIAAGFGLGLAFGAFAGLLWITAIRRVGPGRGIYPYTLSAILALYVVTDTLGGIGALAVLVFGAVVSNAGPLVGALFRPRGTVVEAADEDFRAALDDHSRTVEITRVLLFTFLGLGLGPPWGLVAMGMVLGLLLVVLRLLAARLVLRGIDERTFSGLALGWPRGMLVAGLAALPHAAAVPGTENLTTLVFSAVATTCVAFAVAVSPLGHAHVAEDMVEKKGASGHGPPDMSRGTAARAVAPAPTVDELLGDAAKPAGVAKAGETGLASGAPGGVEAARTAETGGPASVVNANAASDGSPLASNERVGNGVAAGVVNASSGKTPTAEIGDGFTASVVNVAVASNGREGNGLTAAVVAEEPASGTTLTGEPAFGSEREAETLVAGAGVASAEPAVSGRTLVPGEPVVSGRTLVPGEPVVSGRTLVPGEPAAGTRVAEVPRFAPPGASRGAERTIFRASGPGAPELVRHVFVSGPAPSRTSESPVSPTATGLPNAVRVVVPVTRAVETWDKPASPNATSAMTREAELVPVPPRASVGLDAAVPVLGSESLQARTADVTIPPGAEISQAPSVNATTPGLATSSVLPSAAVSAGVAPASASGAPAGPDSWTSPALPTMPSASTPTLASATAPSGGSESAKEVASGTLEVALSVTSSLSSGLGAPAQPEPGLDVSVTFVSPERAPAPAGEDAKEPPLLALVNAAIEQDSSPVPQDLAKETDNKEG